MSQPSPRRSTKSKHFLQREGDGSVRLRIRFNPEAAAAYEEAAGETPIMLWIHRTLDQGAERDIKAARARRASVPPPT